MAKGRKGKKGRKGEHTAELRERLHELRGFYSKLPTCRDKEALLRLNSQELRLVEDFGRTPAVAV